MSLNRNYIYVASSWRNLHQPRVVELLREAGYAVYDFRHPVSEEHGFAWSDIDPNWKNWTTEEYREALEHPIAKKGFDHDYAALTRADIVVLVLPCGRSAHLEAGWAAGEGSYVIVYSPEPQEPELMYKLCDGIVSSEAALLDAMRSLPGW